MTGLLAAALVAAVASAETTIVGDAWVTQTLAVGTTTHSARLHAVMGSTESAVFQVSGVDLSPLLTISTNGRLGLGVYPDANVDLYGPGDSGTSGLELKQGNLYPGTAGLQVTFGQNGSTDRRHAIRSVHLSSTARNGVDFLLWTPADSVSSAGSLLVASLVTTTASASVHIMPTNDPPGVELEVSDGSTLGGGTVHCAAEATHSSRELKTDIAYLGLAEEQQALRDVAALRHVSFKYKGWRKGKFVKRRDSPVRRGLVFEDAPESIRGAGESISIDRRVNNAEMGIKEIIRRLESAEARARGLNP